MKILSIAGRNLNSLRIDFKVDFSTGVLKDCGIFAITGPTGAGKTTLLDAITLALYGKTPRSATDEDIISYGAGEAWAEVIFQTSEGCFKSEWKVRRARSKHDGALQQSTMEVSSYPDGNILTQKKREALDKVKELIKLEYDQFLKSVLLAQGAFKAFLDAKEGERGEMLEKISDTSLYTKLSKKAFERKRKEEQALDALKAKIGNIVLLSNDERVAYAKKINELKDEELRLQKDSAELQIKANWLKMVSDLTIKLQQAENELVVSKQKLEDEQLNLERWGKHQQVSVLELSWTQYISKMEESVLQQQNIEDYQAKLVLSSKEIEQANALQIAAQKKLEIAVTQREEKMPVILAAISRQADLQVEKKQLNIIEEKLTSKQLEESSCKTRILKSETTIINDKKILTELESWVKEHRQYAEAADSCTKASLLVVHLKRSKEDIELYESLLSQATEKISVALKKVLATEHDEQEAEKDLRESGQLQTKTSQQLSKLKNQLLSNTTENNLLLEQAIHLCEQQQNELSRKEFLAEHLSRLHEGESCPLCGATEHPNQVLSITDVRSEIRQIQAMIKQYNYTITANRKRQKTIDNLLSNLEESPESADMSEERLPQNFESIFSELIQVQRSMPHLQHAASLKLASAKQRKISLTESIADLEKRKTDTADQMQLFHKTMAVQVNDLQEIASQFNLGFDSNNPSKLPDTLKKYSEEYHDKTKKTSVLRETIPAMQNGIETITAQIEGIQRDLIQLHNDANNKKTVIRQYENDIILASAGYSSPEAARNKIIADEKLAIELVRKTNEHLNALKQDSGQTEGEKKKTENNLMELRLAIEVLFTDLNTGLASLGWDADINLIRKYLLNKNERLALEKLSRSLNERLVLATAHAETCKNQLDLQRALAITDETADSIADQKKQVGEALQEMNRELGRQQRFIAEDDEKQLRVQFVKKEIEAQEQILEKWASLSNLIGSADGKKFNQFAQGLTLDRLILISNHHLQLLNDRYRLKRNTTDQGLRLLIIDQYQADNEREINTLSGGESFLVSLALALGLSEMTSKLTTIDSLFIDEGFGTLDADTLEVALNALRGLQIGGKTIGIISHVERLKEEIYTQVEITKGADGFSTLRVVPELSS